MDFNDFSCLRGFSVNRLCSLYFKSLILFWRCFYDSLSDLHIISQTPYFCCGFLGKKKVFFCKISGFSFDS